jgi:hypothetical protein
MVRRHTFPLGAWFQSGSNRRYGLLFSAWSRSKSGEDPIESPTQNQDLIQIANLRDTLLACLLLLLLLYYSAA